jgi:hypothetical protein
VTESTQPADCRCPRLRLGSEVTEARNWSETCPAHGIGTDWFDVNMRQRYETFRRRMFPGLEPDWTAEVDLADMLVDVDDEPEDGDDGR